MEKSVSRGGAVPRQGAVPRRGAVLRRGFRPTRSRGGRGAGVRVQPPDLSTITNWSFLDLDAVPRAWSAAESEDSAAATSDTAARNDQIEALKAVVEDQRDLI